MSKRYPLLFAVCAVMASPNVLGQAPDADQNSTVIRTSATEVVLDLVVRDKHHHVVKDLHPAEVQVYEDGVLQKVRAFRAVQGKEQLQTERMVAHTDAARGAAASLSPTQPMNSLRQVNFVSIVFAHIAPQNLELARQAVQEFLKSDDLPNTYVTLYRLNQNLQLLRPYTDNKESLANAVDRATKGLYSKDGLDSVSQVASSSKAELQATAQNVINSPATDSATATIEKNLELNPLPSILIDPLWARNAASEDASTSIGNALLAQADMIKGIRFASSMANGMNAMDSLRALVHGQENLPGRKVVLYLADGLEFPVNRREVVDNLISYANRSGVTFYTLDTRGLSPEDPLMQGLADMQRVGAESVAQVIDPRNGHKEDDDVELSAVSNDQLAMRELAELTGGFSVANTNEIEAPMQRVMEDMRSHYELAYAPTSTRFDGHFRRIDVKVARRKVTVQTRKGYFALPNWTEYPLKPFEVTALKAIDADPAPVAFPVHAALIHFRPKPQEVEYQATFEIPVSGLKAVVNPVTGKAHVQASIVALIHDSHGQVVRKISRELVREVSTSEGGKPEGARILYSESLALPVGSYQMDAAVTDEQAGMSTVKRADVTVDPGTNLGLSSLEVVTRLEPLAGPRNPLNPYELENVRVMPTLAESVASDNPVSLYFVVYPSKESAEPDPKVTLQLFLDGKEVARKPLSVPKREADGSIPMMVQLSPGTGECQIRITAQQGTLVAQSDRSFKIR